MALILYRSRSTRGRTAQCRSACLHPQEVRHTRDAIRTVCGIHTRRATWARLAAPSHSLQTVKVLALGVRLGSDRFHNVHSQQQPPCSTKLYVNGVWSGIFSVEVYTIQVNGERPNTSRSGRSGTTSMSVKVKGSSHTPVPTTHRHLLS